MATRPDRIEVRSHSQASTNSSSSRPLRSPRLHIAGEVPPELSPLDAFALQSRMLAKQLEESSTKAGRRVSRLPPLTTASPVIMQGRSEYFRALSYDSPTDPNEVQEPLSGGGRFEMKPEVEDAFGENRPVSMHPRMSRLPGTAEDIPPPPPNFNFDSYRTRAMNNMPSSQAEPPSFGARREESPPPMESSELSLPPSSPNHNLSPFTMPPTARSPQKSASSDSTGLAPPRPYFASRPSSSLSSSADHGERAFSNSFHSLPPRTLSSASSVYSMQSPPPAPFQRSPSIRSDMSVPLPRPSFNFSRPISRMGTPGLETPTRQASSDSQPPTFGPAEDTAHTPVSMNSESFDNFGDDAKSGAAQSYIYSKFSLPRGKTIQRSVPLDGQPPESSEWDQSSNSRTGPPGAPPSPPTRPSSASSKTAPFDFHLVATAPETGPAPQPSPNPSRPSTEGRSSEESPRGRSLISPRHDSLRGGTAMSVMTSDSASTIKPPRSQHSFAPSASELSAEEHLAKGIECHENGSLNESTYHLRHAAKQNHPTGMLLYALACRHGWGMRPNQREGVEWLRKAAESASLEIADDEDQLKEGKHVNVLEQRTRKAQFALSIYELGVSHMNGWGIEQDRALALRCFEIAGTWGDVDALAEAGFCYAQGIGCKKDLKKSAKFYRAAEAKGMSMVGNSWIHKSKYNEKDELSKSEGKAKKPRSKSRTRTLFGLKSAS